MKRIIHLSDIHIGYKDLSTTMGDIVNRIIFTKEHSANYVIVITGDMEAMKRQRPIIIVLRMLDLQYYLCQETTIMERDLLEIVSM